MRKSKKKGTLGQKPSLRARVIKCLSTDEGISDSELCSRLGISKLQGSQIRYLLFRDGIVEFAGTTTVGTRVVKLWKTVDRGSENNATSFTPPEYDFRFVSNTNNEAISDKLVWIARIIKSYPDFVERILPAKEKEAFYGAINSIEGILNHPFNYLLGKSD